MFLYLICLFLGSSISLCFGSVSDQQSYITRDNTQVFLQSPEYKLQKKLDRNLKKYYPAIDLCVMGAQRKTIESLFACDMPSSFCYLTREAHKNIYAMLDEIKIKSKREFNSNILVFMATRGTAIHDLASYKLDSQTIMIVIGKKILSSISDESLRAIFAHEYAHGIKKHHEKRLLFDVSASFLAGSVLAYQGYKISGDILREHLKKNYKTYLKNLLYSGATGTGLYIAYRLARGILVRSHEREADQFAADITGQKNIASGLLYFSQAEQNYFENMQKKYAEQYENIKKYVRDNQKISHEKSEAGYNFVLEKLTFDKPKKYIKNTHEIGSLLDEHPSLKARLGYIEGKNNEEYIHEV